MVAYSAFFLYPSPNLKTTSSIFSEIVQNDAVSVMDCAFRFSAFLRDCLTNETVANDGQLVLVGEEVFAY